MNSHLKKLENESIYIFREAYRSIKNISMLWSLGKDSNVMVWIAFKAFLGKIPFPLVHVDTGKKFKEMYDFRNKYEKKWNIKLIKGDCPPVEEIDPSLPPAARSAARKTEGLKKILKMYKFEYHKPTSYIRDERGIISLKNEIHSSNYWDNLEPELV